MFTAGKNSTVTMTANAVSQSAALPAGGGMGVVIFNRGPGEAFVEFSSGNTPVAVAPSGVTAGGFCIAANAPASVLRLRSDDAYFAAVSTSNSTLYVSRVQL